MDELSQEAKGVIAALVADKNVLIEMGYDDEHVAFGPSAEVSTWEEIRRAFPIEWAASAMEDA